MGFLLIKGLWVYTISGIINDKWKQIRISEVCVLNVLVHAINKELPKRSKRIKVDIGELRYRNWAGGWIICVYSSLEETVCV